MQSQIHGPAIQDRRNKPEQINQSNKKPPTVLSPIYKQASTPNQDESALLLHQITQPRHHRHLHPAGSDSYPHALTRFRSRFGSRSSTEYLRLPRLLRSLLRDHEPGVWLWASGPALLRDASRLWELEWRTAVKGWASIVSGERGLVVAECGVECIPA